MDNKTIQIKARVEAKRPLKLREQYSYYPNEKELKNMTLIDATGWIVHYSKMIEGAMDRIILNKFNPTNRIEFSEIVLHTTVISFGAKIKILQGTSLIDDKLSELIRKAAEVRNAFAHAVAHEGVYREFSELEPEKMTVQLETLEVSTLNSKGKIVTDNAVVMLESFWSKHKEIMKSLNDINSLLINLPNPTKHTKA